MMAITIDRMQRDLRYLARRSLPKALAGGRMLPSDSRGQAHSIWRIQYLKSRLPINRQSAFEFK